MQAPLQVHHPKERKTEGPFVYIFHKKLASLLDHHALHEENKHKRTSKT
jgi:hypothetical protein